MGQAQINVRTRPCSRTYIARTKQAALTRHVRGKELISFKIDRAVWSPTFDKTTELQCTGRVFVKDGLSRDHGLHSRDHLP